MAAFSPDMPDCSVASWQQGHIQNLEERNPDSCYPAAVLRRMSRLISLDARRPASEIEAGHGVYLDVLMFNMIYSASYCTWGPARMTSSRLRVLSN